ncbi:hypothetical protein DDE03_09460 [Bifidobacterium longum subsp. longum]|nr:hypothetical protein [Bifidobacterium longum subsp. longum]
MIHGPIKEHHDHEIHDRGSQAALQHRRRPRVGRAGIQRKDRGRPILPQTRHQPSRPRTPDGAIATARTGHRDAGTTTSRGNAKHANPDRDRRRTDHRRTVFQASRTGPGGVRGNGDQQARNTPNRRRHRIRHRSGTAAQRPVHRTLARRHRDHPCANRQQMEADRAGIAPIPRPSGHRRRRQKPSPRPRTAPPPAQREIRRLPAQGLIPGGNRARPPPQGLLRRHRTISGSRTMNGNDNNGQPLDIIVQGTPITKGSVQPWRTKHGKAVSVDARLQSWEAAIRGTAVSMMTASGLKPYDCPISITGEIRVPRTDKLHDLPAWQTAKTSGGGDLDKLQRAIGDALQTTNSRYPGRNREGVISNDSRIIHWQISKRYADETRPEGVYLTIRPISTPELPDWQPATPAGRTIHDNLQRRSQRLADMLRQHPHDRKDTTK